MISPIDSYGRAIAAYNRAATADTAPADDPQPASAGGSFAELLGRTVNDGIAAGRGAETASVAAVAGSADLSHVVSAVAEAETTLQTVVAVRERIIEAYKEIMRMPI